jgi:N-acetylglutamate synthase-like GNAT family acetyltransferase
MGCFPLKKARSNPASADNSFATKPAVHSLNSTAMTRDFQVRRAVLDDLPALTGLWQSMHFPTDELERRLTDFQVAVAPDGAVIGAVAIEISGRHGRLHSEAFTDFALADPLREAFWHRVQSLATNHGIVRLWTQETAPFWRQCGLAAPEPEKLQKLPADWTKHRGDWFTLELRDEAAVEKALDQEFAKLIEMDRATTKDILRPARVLNNFATWTAIILAIGVLIIAIYMLANRAKLPPVQ